MAKISRPHSCRFRVLQGAAILAALFACIIGGLPSEIQAQSRADDNAAADTWGGAVDGLQARVVAIARSTDEDKPALPSAVESPKFFRAQDATFLVELKNVSDKPISLQGTRYGKNVSPPWPGKSASNEFAPHLFTCEFF